VKRKARVNAYVAAIDRVAGKVKVADKTVKRHSRLASDAETVSRIDKVMNR